MYYDLCYEAFGSTRLPIARYTTVSGTFSIQSNLLSELLEPLEDVLFGNAC
jgi:hypothetical protein